ncbi:SPC12-domain-containing protein [Polychaeton citri CBS 116435]|uniref:Signal peptidase complex subunit 1 n=1 Tax=Polychaeton citri CBS 116435 TaxID=1314669 RepID=A0A9P4Q4R7_9PEZI|nr:SPC12-domain-containing protein [Polychaeton citri CBS 116435]
MDVIPDSVRVVLEGEIDFKGQQLAEYLTTVLLAITGVLAFLAGFATQDIYNTLYIGLAGTALTFLVAIPPWPVYNQNPLPFLPSRTGRMDGLQGINIEVDGKRVS